MTRGNSDLVQELTFMIPCASLKGALEFSIAVFSYFETFSVQSGGILQAEGRPAKRTRSSGPVSSSAKKVLDSVEVDGVDEETVERLKVGPARLSAASFPLIRRYTAMWQFI